MHFGFTSDSWNIDLWDIYLLDIDLDLFVGHGWIQISPVNILFVSKTSWRRLEEMSWRHIQGISSRRLEDVLEDEKLLHWRRVEDVFKTSWRLTNIEIINRKNKRNKKTRRNRNNNKKN